MQPGDMVQVDTLDLWPLPGVILKHFTARDMVSLDVLEVHTRATARPHQGIGYRTPQQYLRELAHAGKG